MLYQLGKYNTKSDLSVQAEKVRNHLQRNGDFGSIYEIIKEYENLEFETVLILSKAINAGYWNSEYGFNWSKEDELKFWKTVYSKSKELSISKLQILRTLQIAGNNKVESLLDEYVALLNSEPSLYYELMSEDLNGIWKTNKKLKESCLTAMIIHLSLDMDFNEFSKEIALLKELHYKDGIIPESINNVVNRIKNEKNVLQG